MQTIAVSKNGVPVVLEQKTTIIWKCLYLLISLKDSPGLGGVYDPNRRGGEENPVHGRNTTVNVDKIRGFRPPYVWTKPFVFLLTLDRERTDRCFLYACYGNPWERHEHRPSPLPAHINLHAGCEGDRSRKAVPTRGGGHGQVCRPIPRRPPPETAVPTYRQNDG
jgi:hypothetical protein